MPPRGPNPKIITSLGLGAGSIRGGLGLFYALQARLVHAIPSSPARSWVLWQQLPMRAVTRQYRVQQLYGLVWSIADTVDHLSLGW